MSKLIKQWLLFYKMPALHESWFYVRHCWVLSSLRASFVMKPFFTPGGRPVENGCTEMFSGCVHLAPTWL